MAGERCVSELCGGAGGVPDTGEPGPGWGDGRIRALVDAHDRRNLRDCDPADAAGEDADVCEFGNSGGALCCADDFAEADSPLLAEFGRLHRMSVTLESGVLLAGLAAMYFMVKDLAS